MIVTTITCDACPRFHTFVGCVPRMKVYERSRFSVDGCEDLCPDCLERSREAERDAVRASEHERKWRP